MPTSRRDTTLAAIALALAIVAARFAPSTTMAAACGRNTALAGVESACAPGLRIVPHDDGSDSGDDGDDGSDDGDDAAPR